MTRWPNLHAELVGEPAKPSKYRNRKVEVDGIVFHSAKEAKRYGELKLLERAGKITALRLQPRFPLTVNGLKVCTYVGDFEYADEESRPLRGAMVVEDVKGFKTDTYKLKAKLFHAVFGFAITEV